MDSTPAQQIAMHFDGTTIRDDPDANERLSGLLGRVYAFMADGGWHSIGAIRAASGGTEASVSARLRDLRKPRFGQHRVDRRCIGNGLWIYRLVLDEDGVPGAPLPALVASAVRS